MPVNVRSYLILGIVAMVLVAGAMVVFSSPGAPSGTTALSATVGTPPRAASTFKLQPVGAWSTLPGEAACARRVRRSTWEPRPDNAVANATMPDVAAVHASFVARPVAVQGAYDERWDTWLLQRVTGHFAGTTDEVFQWAACKWGLNDNLLRAMAVRESNWYQYLAYPSGRCTLNYGCGDEIAQPSRATQTYCATLARYGHDYREDYSSGGGICPKTFGILGVMSWRDPLWGARKDNQNGTFPFNRNSTAFVADYVGSQLRGCYEGWEWWLRNTGSRTYTAGQLWGCVGAWYAGDWWGPEATGYVVRVRAEWHGRPWLSEAWPRVKPACSATYGCPGGGNTS